MGAKSFVKLRVVFDSTTVVSALCFPGGRLSWLIGHWRDSDCRPLISRVTASELTRVLAYPKFGLSPTDRIELLGDYIPFCERIEIDQPCTVTCRDLNDQPFLDLAQSGRADVLVSGDLDLLSMAGQTGFAIETPEAYRKRVAAA